MPNLSFGLTSGLTSGLTRPLKGKAFGGSGSAPVVLPATVKITGEGDSNTAGNGASSVNATYFNSAIAAMTAGPTYTINNIGLSGISLFTQVANYATRVGAGFDGTKAMNILTIMSGTNTSGANDDSAVEKFQLLRSICRAARATGYQRIILITYPPRNDDGGTAWTTVLTPFNQYIRDWYYAECEADYLVDLQTLTAFDAAADADNTTYYNVDKLHINDAGNALIKDLLLPKLNTSLTTAGPAVPGAYTLQATTFNDFFNVTFSNGNRTITIPSGFGQCGARGINGFRTGLWYFETKLNVLANNFETGLRNTSWTHGSRQGVDANTVGYTHTGTVLRNNATIATLAPIAAGMTVQHCYDRTNNLLWMRLALNGKVGAWNASPTADPVTGVGGIDVSGIQVAAGRPIYPAMMINSGTDSCTMNFTDSEMVGPIPTGFQTVNGVTGSGSSAASVAAIGVEQVTNGGFATDTDWTKYTGVTISGGVLNCSSATTIMTQGIYLSPGTYTLQYSYTRASGANIRVRFAMSDTGTNVDLHTLAASGTRTVPGIVVAAGGFGITFAADGAVFSGTIDNVSVIRTA